MRDAVLNGDEALVRLLLSGQVKVLPYVLNPTNLTFDHAASTDTWAALSPLSSKRSTTFRQDHADHAASLTAPKAADDGHADDRQSERSRHSQTHIDSAAMVSVCQESALTTNECLLHMAIHTSMPKLPIVSMLLEYMVNEEDLVGQLYQDTQTIVLYVPGHALWDDRLCDIHALHCAGICYS